MVAMKIAKLIKNETSPTGASQNLYWVDPAIRFSAYNEKTNKYVRRRTKYILVSAVTVPFTGSETYIFPADKKGNVKSWNELDGSYHGGLSHDKALKNAGYENAD